MTKFYTYNNGIACTASKVTLSSDGHMIESMEDLQIINGGQTHICMILDLCDQNDLFDAICDQGTFSEEEAKKLMRSLFKAVNYLHQFGIVHRDIKAENVLFKDGQPVLADFGLADFCKVNENCLTEYCGTSGTTAPEIIKKNPIKPETDWYSLGALIYEMICGLPPFWNENIEALSNSIIILHLLS